LDQHVRDIVRTHFDPERGAPYWIRRAKELALDPFREILGFSDLTRLGFFDPENLRTLSPTEFLPRSRLDFSRFAPQVFETGGTTGRPKRVIDTAHQEANGRWVSEVMRLHGFGRKGWWLDMFPSGPHAVSRFTYNIARAREELRFCVDLDPRWVKKMGHDGQVDVLDRYVDHVIEQAVSILESEPIRYLFTTPRLLERLVVATDLRAHGIEGILCGGTEISRELHRQIRTKILPQGAFCALYGNTLMGVAPQAPGRTTSLNDPWSIGYYGHFPHFVIELVDQADASRCVSYGVQGQVKVTVMNEDLLLPQLLERDVGTRLPPSAGFGWDGIADVQTMSSLQGELVEGVY
jgi:hypothetical protein